MFWLGSAIFLLFRITWLSFWNSQCKEQEYSISSLLLCMFSSHPRDIVSCCLWSKKTRPGCLISSFGAGKSFLFFNTILTLLVLWLKCLIHSAKLQRWKLPRVDSHDSKCLCWFNSRRICSLELLSSSFFHSDSLTRILNHPWDESTKQTIKFRILFQTEVHYNHLLGITYFKSDKLRTIRCSSLLSIKV